MQDTEGSEIDEAFVEDDGATFDPNDHYKLLEVASGRTRIPADSDLHWRSTLHHVGRFWVVAPREGRPELVSYRRRFIDAERLDHERLGLGRSHTFEVCWLQLQDGEEHLTPHQRPCVVGKASNDWRRGEVTYSPHERTWTVRIAEDLVDDEDTLLAVRQRFVIDRARCRVIGDAHLD